MKVEGIFSFKDMEKEKQTNAFSPKPAAIAGVLILFSLMVVITIIVFSNKVAKKDAPSKTKVEVVYDEKPKFTAYFKAQSVDNETISIIHVEHYVFNRTPYFAGDKVLVDLDVESDAYLSIRDGNAKEYTNGAVYKILYQVDLEGNKIGAEATVQRTKDTVLQDTTKY